MLDQAKAIVLGTVGTAIKQMGIKCSQSEADELLKFENWKHVDSYETLIDRSTYLLFEYQPGFMQVELRIQGSTVVGINLITDPMKRLKYAH